MTYTLNHRSYMNYTYKKKTLPKKALFSGFHFYKKIQKIIFQSPPQLDFQYFHSGIECATTQKL